MSARCQDLVHSERATGAAPQRLGGAPQAQVFWGLCWALCVLQGCLHAVPGDEWPRLQGAGGWA